MVLPEAMATCSADAADDVTADFPPLPVVCAALGCCDWMSKTPDGCAGVVVVLVVAPVM